MHYTEDQCSRKAKSNRYCWQHQYLAKKLTKVLFLDIDGVVNSRATTSFRNNLYPIDPHMAFMIGKIQLETDCGIVLSSSWRHHPDGVMAVDRSIVHVDDVTPMISAGVRGHEIQTWLDAHPDVTRYAILDDDSDMLPNQIPNFFKTTFQNGLTEDIAQRVTQHLNAKQA